MTIRMTIEIEETHGLGLANEFGAGVRVMTDGQQLHAARDSEGQTWVGLCMAINDYMRARGAPTFDCLKRSPAGAKGDEPCR